MKEINPGHDVKRVENANRFVYAGSADGWWGNGDTGKMVDAAVNDISAGKFNILREFFACVNSHGSVCRYHTCRYGIPVHEIIALCIRATKAWRRGEIAPDENDLTDILYYLNLLRPNPAC